MTQLSLSQEELAVINKVEKLLALANSANEHEAALANEKAQELLTAYNLDIAMIGKKPVDSKRNDTKMKGGLYQWQRELWNAVAQTNFCMYRYYRGLAKGSSYEHRIIGSHVNVISTKVMAEYLQATVERLAQKWANERHLRSVFVKEAIAYREGMSERLVNRLWELRWQREKEAEKQQAAAPSDRGDGKALILMEVVHNEEDLNWDYIMGYEPGTTSRERRANEAKRAAAKAAAEKMLADMLAAELANPALREARLRKEAEAERERERQNAEWERKYKKQRERALTTREKRRELGGFYAGHRDGADISLNKQIDENATRRLK